MHGLFGYLAAAALGAWSCGADHPTRAVAGQDAVVARPPVSPASTRPKGRTVQREAPRAARAGEPSRLDAATGSTPPPTIAHGGADLDPDNDDLVAPPEALPGCEERLTAAGVAYRPTSLPLRQRRGEVFTCGAHQAVVYLSGPTTLRFIPRPVVTCQMALALAHFERRLQPLAERHLGTHVARIEQMGTYACRKMDAYPTMVSEHSYANAIDLSTFVLDDGRRISVARHFGSPAAEPKASEAEFLRTLARDLFDADVFSVVLTPFFDAHHRDHFHVDLARYRVDGTRR